VDRDADQLARPLRPGTSQAPPRRVAVIGGGWAGVAAAIEATARGHRVTLFEMAAQLGGRARRVDIEGLALDNGQHILIGAYRQTLAMMRRVGVDPAAALLRLPLRLVHPDGRGFVLRPGTPGLAFVRAVWSYPGWCWRDRGALLVAAGRWSLLGFRCAAETTVEQLCRGITPAVRRDVIEPLCIAALNTPAREASARVFLRVLRDALFGGPGASDLLLPRRHLSALLPEPGARWLQAHGAELQLSRRVMRVEADGSGWRVDDAAFDVVVLATPPGEAARLARGAAPGWAAAAAALCYRPIVTVYVRSPGTCLIEPMLSLPADDAAAPAQFVFDLGALRGHAGVLAFVVSGADAWVERGLEATLQATLEQARRALGPALHTPPEGLQAFVERRATFACTPGLQRPSSRIADGLFAAGDYVDGPYPATLEGAVRAGIAAVDAFR
jgi:hydroxysqualene dehydroxylase